MKYEPPNYLDLYLKGQERVVELEKRVTQLTQKQDAYWLRQYAGMAMQAMISDPDRKDYSACDIAKYSVYNATTLLDAIKKEESKP